MREELALNSIPCRSYTRATADVASTMAMPMWSLQAKSNLVNPALCYGLRVNYSSSNSCS